MKKRTIIIIIIIILILLAVVGIILFNNSKEEAVKKQLKVATAIVRRLNPQCSFVLLDKLEQMDLNTLKEFGEWLEEEGLQAIATRVSTGDECSVIIEDGYVVGEEKPLQEPIKPKSWEGAF